MNPLVSIIVPAYNAEAFIQETLHSICQSEYQPIEIIVVDDGSTDSTLALAQQMAAQDSRIQVHHQSNSGVCRARNHAISLSHGEYILPVDADDLISPQFIPLAVEAIQQDHVSVVYCQGEFFGTRTGPWKLPPFSHALLARRNMIPVTALYRRADWERVGGYSETIIASEDWAFWIAILKDGSQALQLPHLGFHYRIHKVSKRKADRKYKKHVINTLNALHPEFFKQYLGGPLRYQRTWSKAINAIASLFNKIINRKSSKQ